MHQKDRKGHYLNIMICGSSGFINGTVKSGTTGKILKGRGIMQDLMEIEGVQSEKIDKEQYYLQYVQ